MTEKAFLEILIADKKERKNGNITILNRVSAILLDEVHERSMMIDLIMGMV